MNDAETAAADAALENYYRDQKDGKLAIVSAIYHANRQDWQRGFHEWVKVFKSAMYESHHALCESLLELCSEMRLETDFSSADAAYLIGIYAINLSRHEPARIALTEAIMFYDRCLQNYPDDTKALNNRGNALHKLADLLTSLSDHDMAKQSYQHAIDSYDQALKLAPDHINVFNNRGIAQQKLDTLK